MLAVCRRQSLPCRKRCTFLFVDSICYKVVFMIDQMIADLRKEEQDDVDHRDRCENSQNKNSNEKEDLEHAAGVMKEICAVRWLN